MSREPKIAWRQSQQQRLTRSVAKFNAKITRELKKNPELAEFLPQRLDVKKLRSEIRTAKDLKKVVDSVNRAFKPDSFKPLETVSGVKTTNFEFEEAKRRLRQINRDRANELKRADPSPERGTMGIGHDVNLKPKKFNINKMSNKEWGKFKSWAEKEVLSSAKVKKYDLYKENYLKGFAKELGDDNPLYQRISEMNSEQLVELYFKDPVMQLDFVYGREQAEMRIKSIEAHLDYWEKQGG